MGINKLNSFLKQYITDSIRKKSLFQLKGFTIAVDFSIFYYKFKKSKNSRSTNYFIESFQRQINTFKFYDITPIYIFDGKPDYNKSNVIKNRNREINKYIKKAIDEKNLVLKKIYEKKTVKLNIYDINLCKELFRKNSIEFREAEGEADDLCCQLYKDDIVKGIFTEDNDLLLGGAVIYKGLNNFNDVIYEYNLKNILIELNISYRSFLQICLLAGSTYTKKICCIFILYENYKNNKLDIDNFRYEDKEALYNKNVKSDILMTITASAA
tara:strand:+ start:618 stop:1424 length:807 start_codon:yes stop_codon:yes gene_type:complete